MNHVNIKKMSEETGIDVTVINEVLGLIDTTDIVERLERASTIQEVREVYNTTPYGSEIERSALKKWLDFTSTIQEVREVYDTTPNDSEIRRSVLEKLSRLCSLELDTASTIQEVREVYDTTPDGSEIGRSALKKLSTFFEEE